MRLYRTRLYEMYPSDALVLPSKAKGWRVHFRQPESTIHNLDQVNTLASRRNGEFIAQTTSLSQGCICNTYQPEVVIEAHSRLVAQSASSLIIAAKCLLDGELTIHDEYPVIPHDISERDRFNPDESEHELVRSISTSFVAAAAQVAAKATYRRYWPPSLAKYWLSLRICSVPRYSHHPTYGQRFTVSNDPIHHAMMAQAIVAGYSAIEEVGLEIRATRENPSKINGEWNPLVLNDLKNRLQSQKIDPYMTLAWHVRNFPSRIEKRYGLPSGDKAWWAHHDIRDRMVKVTDAIHYASLLRSKVSAHASSRLTKSLKLTDVYNVQFLARRLLLGSLSCWEKLVAGKLG